MKNLLSIIILSIVLISCSENKQDASTTDYSTEVDKVFEDWNENEPGASMAIIRNGQVEYAKGYGLANMEYGIANSPKTVFRIASTSKQFTAACIVLLAEEDKLSLEDPITNFFPEFPEYANSITVRQNHTSGIRDYLQLTYLAGFEDEDFYTDEDVMQFLIDQKDLNFMPGEDHLYSNSGFWLLGQIVLKVTGNTMAVFAEENIFKPLGMTSTHFHDNNSMIVKNRATGYTPVSDGFEISMTQLEMIGDGGIFTTVEDISKWVDNFSSHIVGSPSFTETMETRGILNNGDTLDYALGLDVTEYNGRPIVQHGGAFVGFRAQLVRYPTENLAIVVFANRSDGNPSARARAIADIVFQDQKKDVAKETEKASEYTPTVAELKSYVGSYWSDENMEYQNIILKDDTLYTATYALRPIGPKEFSLIVAPEIKVKFNSNSLLINLPGRDYQEYILTEINAYSKKQLEPFEGKYYSNELKVYYSLEIKGDGLMLSINDNEISPLIQGKGDVFTNDDIGSFEFLRSQGAVSGFILGSGRVRNMKFDKL